MNILNKGKPKHKRMNPRRQWRKLLTALAVAISMAVAPAAMADMNGYDISNWQCGIDTATVPADFVIVGTTWGSGGVYGGCLSNGVNTDANRQPQLPLNQPADFDRYIPPVSIEVCTAGHIQP